MAPRKRQTRIDAAFDNLEPLGFTKKVIRSKVKELLKVYGGDAGWAFIEEASYKLLIEFILEDQEKELLKIESQEVDERALAIGEPSGAGTSYQVDRLDEPTSSEPGMEELKERLEDNNCLLPAAEENLQEKLSFIVSSANKDGDFVFPCITPDRGAGCRRRKPCFGFIDSDEDDEDFVYPVTRASLNCGMIQNRSNGRKERKSRWDVKPDIIMGVHEKSFKFLNWGDALKHSDDTSLSLHILQSTAKRQYSLITAVWLKKKIERLPKSFLSDFFEHQDSSLLSTP
ncbi:WIYLD domain [Macleaya cordata]|uniref:WIYLD domain n=1 Tax=Macleaya cordata TaxID=56857 RepID=A0A200R4J6_MACCD|nr:WIYLD domain [Macleaya cordata]